MTLTHRWFYLVLLGGVILCLGGIISSALVLFMVWVAVLAVATCIDIILLPGKYAYTLERSIEPFLTVGTEYFVVIVIRNSSNRAYCIEAIDEPPISLVQAYPGAKFTIDGTSISQFQYSIRPSARGKYEFGPIWLRTLGPLKLISNVRRHELPLAVKVYPQLKDAAKFSLLARRGRLQQIGMRSIRASGSGHEFESLREYQMDDEYRSIDWKASARTGKLISRQYQTERSQNVVIVLDIGRTMLAEINGKQKLEYALDAAILLAHVAELTDDRVGLMVFSDKVHHWLPPKRGRAQVYSILDALHNVQAGRVEPDYRSAIAYMSSQWRRRSLIICFTDLWDPDSSRQTILELSALQPRHLVVCVTLIDTKVLNASQAELATCQNLYARGVAMQVLEDRQRASALLKRRGVLVVDSPADSLSLALVSQYLKVKERNLL